MNDLKKSELNAKNNALEENSSAGSENKCPCDCWVESCLECTCCRCKEVWTEGTENTCEGSCEDCVCEKCSCEECTCDEECCDPWEETVCDPSGECTCEECCCEECTCDEECCDPWEETVCDPSGECTCEECCCEECACEKCCCKECTCKEWCDAWEETTCGSGMECTCEECCCEECTCDEAICDPWEETVCDPSGECTCEECCCEKCTCDKECCDPWEETVCDPSGECTCEECCCEECTCDEECCDPWEETVCDPSGECTCEECCCENSCSWGQESGCNSSDACDCENNNDTSTDENSDNYNSSISDGNNDTEWESSHNNEIPMTINVYPTKHTMLPTAIVRLSAEICPCCYEGTPIVWRSLNTNIATVDQTGKVTAGTKGGTTTIVVYAGGTSARCTITVDTRKLVRVTKEEVKNPLTGRVEEEYFKAVFVEAEANEGRIWRSVGVDMELDENRTLNSDGYKINIYDTDDANLKGHEVRHKNNMLHTFTPQQLALLYRMDPYGVVFYVKEYARKNFNISLSDDDEANDDYWDMFEAMLRYKDDVYCAIFDVKKTRFYFLPDSNGNPDYQSKYNPANGVFRRKDVFSDAEFLFGKHTILDFDWVDFVVTGVIALFSAVWPSFGVVMSAIEMSQALFFSGAIAGELSSGATETLGLFVEQTKEKWRDLLFNCMGFLLDVIEGAIEATEITSITSAEMCRCLKNNQDYRVMIYDGNRQLSMQEIISLLG